MFAKFKINFNLNQSFQHMCWEFSGLFGYLSYSYLLTIFEDVLLPKLLKLVLQTSYDAIFLKCNEATQHLLIKNVLTHLPTSEPNALVLREK